MLLLLLHFLLSAPFLLVLGGQESRGVLRKISDMLEVIMKRMDTLSKLGNTTDAHKLDELSTALDRCSKTLISKYQEYVQCIAMWSTHP